MGIKNLNKFLKKHCIEVFEEIHISKYAYKKVAIDISLYLCKFKIISGDRWLGQFINLISCLRRNEIHCIFIYDNGAPPEKLNERNERAKSREKIQDKIYILEEALSKYYRTGEIDPELLELYNKNSKGSNKRLLSKRQKFNIEIVEDKIKKMKSYMLNLTPKDFELTKKLFDILNVPWLVAPLEAETMCADLCKRGLIDAVLSEDTDVIAYGCPFFLCKINSSKDTCVEIKYEQILTSLNLNSNSMLDFCIMCGTDYNKNIPKIGPENAYKYIMKYGDIDGIGMNTELNINILNHERSRELFLDYEQYEIEKIKYCGIPDFELLTRFVFKYNIKIDIEGLKSSFQNNDIIFEE